jgi:hypothetical protein
VEEQEEVAVALKVEQAEADDTVVVETRRKLQPLGMAPASSDVNP